MSDEELRTAARRWAASGSLDDEIELLRARLTAGGLDTLRVWLAALCGSEAALALLPEAERPIAADLEGDLRRLLVEPDAIVVSTSQAPLPRSPIETQVRREAATRAAVALARAVWAGEGQRPSALSLIEASLVPGAPPPPTQALKPRDTPAARVAKLALEVVANAGLTDYSDAWVAADVGDVGVAAAELLGERACREILRSEVGHWLLGHVGAPPEGRSRSGLPAGGPRRL